MQHKFYAQNIRADWQETLMMFLRVKVERFLASSVSFSLLLASAAYGQVQQPNYSQASLASAPTLPAYIPSATDLWRSAAQLHPTVAGIRSTTGSRRCRKPNLFRREFGTAIEL